MPSIESWTALCMPRMRQSPFLATIWPRGFYDRSYSVWSAHRLRTLPRQLPIFVSTLIPDQYRAQSPSIVLSVAYMRFSSLRWYSRRRASSDRAIPVVRNNSVTRRQASANIRAAVHHGLGAERSPRESRTPNPCKPDNAQISADRGHR
jgi:hypothetical protein